MSIDESTIQLLERIENRYLGKYRGIVTDNQDPNNLGRIKANVPDILADVETGWALPCVPYSGNGSGSFAVPEPGTGVWIEFEAGDVSHPIWTGCWWGDGQLPANESGTAATPPLKIIRSESGLMVVLDDDSQEITVSDDAGSNMLKITVQEGQVKILGGSKVVIEAPMIEIVEGATHPVVFGDQLLQYLNQLVQAIQTHTHPGQTAGPLPVTPTPPASPIPTPTSALLSTKVNSG